MTFVEFTSILEDAYCSQEDFGAFASFDRPESAFRVGLRGSEMALVDQYFAARWGSSAGIPPDCGQTGAANSILAAEEAARRAEEDARLQGICDEMTSYFLAGEVGAGAHGLDPPWPLDEAGHCPQQPMWSAIAGLIGGDGPVETRLDDLAENAAMVSALRQHQWIWRELAPEICATGDVGYMSTAWQFCDEDAQRNVLHANATSVFDGLDSVSRYRFYEDEDGYEVTFEDGSRAFVPLFALSPNLGSWEGLVTWLSSFHSRSASRSSLCEVVESRYRAEYGRGDFIGDRLGGTYEVRRDGSARCVERYERNGGYLVTGRFTWPSRNVHSGRSMDIYRDFACFFWPVELPSRIYYELGECIED